MSHEKVCEKHAKTPARGYSPCAGCEVERLQQQLESARAEAAHWKSNHDTQVQRARLLMERPDLPVERVQAYERVVALEGENDRLRAELEAASRQEPVAAQARFEGEQDWRPCTVLHHHHVKACPKEWPHYETRALYAAPVPADRDRWHIESLTADIKRKYEQIAELNARTFARFNNEDCWIFQGDGNDNLESLVCPVVIAPEKLRELIAAPVPGAPSVPDGWQLVPKEPTIKMQLAGGNRANYGIPEDTYRAMLAVAPKPPQHATQLSAAARDVLAERRRQIESEGWSPEHDDEHRECEMARAAACYALDVAGYSLHEAPFWPWDRTWWKPSEPRRDLVKAAALILAEIERLDRAADTVNQPAEEDA